MSGFTAFYERKFSDGNYGSEGLALSWTWETDGDEVSGESLEVAVAFLKRTVLTELSTSRAERVAWAAARELNPPSPAVATDVQDSLEDLPF